MTEAHRPKHASPLPTLLTIHQVAESLGVSVQTVERTPSCSRGGRRLLAWVPSQRRAMDRWVLKRAPSAIASAIVVPQRSWSQNETPVRCCAPARTHASGIGSATLLAGRVRDHERVGVVRDVRMRCLFELDDCSSLVGVIVLQDEQRVSWVSTSSPIRSDAPAL